MPVTRGLLKRNEQHRQERIFTTAVSTPARSSAIASKSETPSNTTNEAASLNVLPAKSPAARNIRRQILNSIIGDRDGGAKCSSSNHIDASKTPMKNALVATPIQAPPMTARRARYERAKRRHDGKNGQLVSLAIDPSPDPLTITKRIEAATTGYDGQTPQKMTPTRELFTPKRINSSALLQAKKIGSAKPTTTKTPSCQTSPKPANPPAAASTATADNHIASPKAITQPLATRRKSQILSNKLEKRPLIRPSSLSPVHTTKKAAASTAIEIAAGEQAPIPPLLNTQPLSKSSIILVPSGKIMPATKPRGLAASALTSRLPLRPKATLGALPVRAFKSPMLPSSQIPTTFSGKTNFKASDAKENQPLITKTQQRMFKSTRTTGTAPSSRTTKLPTGSSVVAAHGNSNKLMTGTDARPLTMNQLRVRNKESRNISTALFVKTSYSPKNPSRISPANDSGKLTRQNLDKRTARFKFAKEFTDQIASYKDSDICSMKVIAATSQACPTIRAIVRKRPLFDHEIANKDFDVVRVLKGSNTVCIFDTRLQSDGKTPAVQPVTFSCHEAFDDAATNEQVYRESVQPLVHMASGEAKAATVLLFGQTGSGKSFTCSAMEEFVALDLFKEPSATAVQVKCIEIAKKCKDLIGDGNAEVKIMNSGSTVQFVGATAVQVATAKDFLSLLQMSKEARATKCTDKNTVSSRSHAICQITIKNRLSKQVGVLTLVDCAGTERRNDSLYHNKERQAESAEITASLCTLKQCIRAKMNHCKSPTRNPIRESNLTRALQNSLEQPDAALLVIATISPNATDTEHTIETLRTVMDLMGGDSADGIESKQSKDASSGHTKSSALNSSTSPRTCDVAPKNWTREQLVAFLISKRLLSPTSVVPESMTGRQIMRMAKPQLRHAFFADYEQDCMPKVDVLFQSLRAENDRVARLEFKRRFAQAKMEKKCLNESTAAIEEKTSP
ncbi:hypothetical protein MPSEU_000289100 [Mayamaea pseudoterrestris]|nr:hypothetical protein MPSEU_000289100 [Mayamaea pseudoterrestris]